MTEERPKGREERSRPAVLKGDRPASIGTLRKTYKDRLKPQDRQAMARELNGESDRASIILMASVLDDGLIYLLTSKLGYAVDENDLEHIFRFEGPLGTFSSRIEIANLFGFIDNDMFEQLRTVREMRNACAHAQKPMKFSDPALANVGRRMFRPVGLYDPPSGDAELFKLLFINEGLFLYLFLRRGSRAAAYRELIANQPEAVALLPPLPDKWHER